MISILALRRLPFPRTGMAAVAAALALLAAAPAGAADIHKGGSLYATHCAMCHGANGNPVLPGTPNFRRMETLMRPDLQILPAIKNGKGSMPGFFGILRDQEVLDVIAYLRTLS